MGASKTKRPSRAGDTTTFDYAFLTPGDGSGDSPAHAAVDAAGTLINPARDETVAALATLMGEVLAALGAQLSVGLPSGAASDSKLEAVRTLLAGTIVTARAGSTGTDYSASAAAVPATAALITIPTTPGRAFVEVQNQSGAALQVVRDDGNGGNVTSILLAPGAGAGQQGGGWSSNTFKGRVRVFGPAGSQVAAYQD